MVGKMKCLFHRVGTNHESVVLKKDNLNFIYIYFCFNPLIEPFCSCRRLPGRFPPFPFQAKASPEEIMNVPLKIQNNGWLLSNYVYFELDARSLSNQHCLLAHREQFVLHRRDSRPGCRMQVEHTSNVRTSLVDCRVQDVTGLKYVDFIFIRNLKLVKPD
jgi:hypothetical protein